MRVGEVAERAEANDETSQRTTLHVTNGDSTGSTLARSTLRGRVMSWQDVLHEGPVPDVPRRQLHTVRAEFLSALSENMQPGDTLLLGTDLVKDVDRLVRAYDDRAGVTARFNKNVLAVVNRELGADFDLDAFAHVARWNADEERIEMWLRATSPQRVRVAALDLTVDFAAGEEMLTEVSCKFRPDGVADELSAGGLRRTHWWTDEAGDFGLSLSTK